MKSANVEKSVRLQKVLWVLWDKLPHTTREIIYRSGQCAINTCVDELRDNGYKIECQRKGKYWYYRLA